MEKVEYKNLKSQFLFILGQLINEDIDLKQDGLCQRVENILVNSNCSNQNSSNT